MQMFGAAIEVLTLELGADACDEGSEALAEALVHVDVGGRHAEQQLQHQRQRRLDVRAEHRAARVGDQRQRVQRPHLHSQTHH